MMQAGQRHQNYAMVQAAQNVTGSPKLDYNQALQIALKAQPGSVVNEELENEQGGSGLRYSFDVKVGADTHEVGVDAMNGALLENSVEGPNPD
ncbi:MAG: PepSY domain-containing protein [Rhodospirillales bacterium]|nr:PepSY domain-containing protein [Rhodospirillales bacterium]